jgi:hypothetical protein
MNLAKIGLSVAALSLFVTAPAFAQSAPTAEQCNAWLAKADTNGDGSLGTGENTQYIEMMNKTATTKMDANSALQKDAFLDACTKGTFGMPPAQ